MLPRAHELLGLQGPLRGGGEARAHERVERHLRGLGGLEVAGPERPDDGAHALGDDVGGDAHDAVAAEGQHRQREAVVAGKQVELEARKDASELQKEADLKEADVEAMKAMIAKLQGMIQQLQDDLEEQMEKGENVLQSILTPIKDRMTTTETLVQNIGA